MSGSSIHAARIIGEQLGKSGEPVFSSGNDCRLLTPKEIQAESDARWGDNKPKDDPYSISKSDA
jgi:hypothetical protein